MGLAGTFSGGKSRRQTIMRMVESESFTPEEVWKYLTGQNVFTNRERITKMIEKDGQAILGRLKGYLSKSSQQETKIKIKWNWVNNTYKNKPNDKKEKLYLLGIPKKTQ